MSDFGVAIAGPVVLFVLAGRWLDARYRSGVAYTVIAFLLAALSSAIFIYKKTKQYAQEYGELIHRDGSKKESV